MAVWSSGPFLRIMSKNAGMRFGLKDNPFNGNKYNSYNGNKYSSASIASNSISPWIEFNVWCKYKMSGDRLPCNIPDKQMIFLELLVFPTLLHLLDSRGLSASCSFQLNWHLLGFWDSCLPWYLQRYWAHCCSHRHLCLDFVFFPKARYHQHFWF